MTDTEMKMAETLVRAAGMCDGIAEGFAENSAFDSLVKSLRDMHDECVAAVRLVLPNFDREETLQ